MAKNLQKIYKIIRNVNRLEKKTKNELNDQQQKINMK